MKERIGWEHAAFVLLVVAQAALDSGIIPAGKWHVFSEHAISGLGALGVLFGVPLIKRKAGGIALPLASIALGICLTSCISPDPGAVRRLVGPALQAQGKSLYPLAQDCRSEDAAKREAAARLIEAHAAADKEAGELLSGGPGGKQ